MDAPMTNAMSVRQPALMSLATCFITFTKEQVLEIIGPIATIPRAAKRNLGVLFQTLETFPEHTKVLFRNAALCRTGTKRKAKDGGAGGRKKRRVEHDPPAAEEPYLAMDVDVPQDIIEGPFFAAPTEETQRGCIERAIDRTGNKAMMKHICMACGRRLFAHLMLPMEVHAIPNKRHLVPFEAHPAHNLTQSLLLHEDALEAGETFLCIECKHKLSLDERPRYALSNGMWIGPRPFELKILTLPERLLIALYFPAAYVVKLYPKVAGARFWDKRAMNSGLKGNVSTYRLNTAQVVDLVSGGYRTMPPSPSVLAATIGVTFVGRTDRPLTVLPDFFRVRRQRVFAALLWLKAHNGLYRDIIISQEQLLLLPEDAVPDEIMMNTRISDDVSVLEREHEGYVPLDVAEEENWHQPDRDFSMLGAASGVNPVEDEPADDQSGPAPFPLQMHGVVDVHAEGVPERDVYAHGYANLATQGTSEGNFKIRRGTAFVNEYARLDEHGQRFDGGPANANHMLGAFPVLFPYGKGGLEVKRDVDVPYEAHVRWALQYSDGRFRKDLYFMFQAFGVIQKREVCRSSGLQIKRSSFMANQVAFLKLQPRDLIQASAEETRRVPYSNPVVRKLRKHLTSLRARVMGTDESRIAVRSQIWGMNLRFNPPSIWATLNLADTSDPIAQVLAGQQIDLDSFIATAGPDRAARAINVASDPFAAAEFFHTVVNILLEEVFGIKKSTKGKFVRKAGVLGLVNGYIGTVEAQGRGTLHLHILFWLVGAVTAAAMQAALQSDSFREKILLYIKQTVRADIKGTDAQAVLTMPKKSAVAYSRPEDPRNDNYELRRHLAEASVARAVQFHDCKLATCLVNKKGRLVCKRRAPFVLSTEDWVLPSGEWGPRRVCSRLNSWNPAVLQIVRANQDIKIITNGHETKDIAFYITLYIAKKQIQSANASALLAKSLAFHKKMNARNLTCRDVNRRMLQQCANTLSRQHEFSGPEVVSYLMGWGDRFISHTFVPIYWDEITTGLKRVFPHLERKNTVQRVAQSLGEGTAEHATPLSEATIRLQVRDGVFVLKDQLKEYSDRGRELESMNLYDYYMQTYHGNFLQTRANDGDDSGDEEPQGDAPQTTRGAGRPASHRVAYLPESKRKGCRIIRGANYETVLQFVGTWFPRADAGDIYFASMLALLKPWRDLRGLKDTLQSFQEAFEALMEGASQIVKTVVANVAYYHECSDSSKRQKDTVLAPQGVVDVNDYIRRDQELEEVNNLQLELTEDDVQLARDNRHAFRDVLYGEHAMNIAKDIGIFDDGPLEFHDDPQDQATLEEMIKYAEWGRKVSSMTRQDHLKLSNTVDVPSLGEVTAGAAEPVEAAVLPDLSMDTPFTRTAEQQKAVDILNVEQRRAHDIIETHLKRTLAGVKQDQLLMIVRGEGGTGKTVLLNAIAHTFDHLRASTALAKTATTGVAASLVGGQTLHAWAGIKIREPQQKAVSDKASTPASVEKRKRNIIPASYLDIDECSMLTKETLAKLSKIVGEVRDAADIGDPSRPFGGLNVILFGDFHQFPPVADTTGALYCPKGTKPLAQLGLEIFHQFTTVVTLTEQIRVTDLPWTSFLQRLRQGACHEQDMDMLRTLLVTEAGADKPAWDQEPWCNAVLVTPRHSVRERWNTAALRRHCRRTGRRMYVCEAEDTLGREESELDLEQRILVAGMTQVRTGKLAERVELAVGMRAMVMTNIATEADLANGTRGEIIDFKLDPREPKDACVDPDTGAIMLKYPPVVVFFKPDKSSFPPFEGLPPGVLPIVPSKMAFYIQTSDGRKHRVHRHQLAMTPAYAFTDYKSQGQTLEYVFIDLEPPPQHGLTPFSAYVALSRSRGRDRIRLLRGFDVSLFTTHPSEDLAREDARLDALTIATREGMVDEVTIV